MSNFVTPFARFNQALAANSQLVDAASSYRVAQSARGEASVEATTPIVHKVTDSPMYTPQSRYVLPSFTESNPYGVKESNPYNKLFEERIIFLGSQVDDTSANDIMAQLLVLEGLDPDRDITMYINSPGGSFTSLMAIYDTMQYVRPDVQTVCLGQAASAAAILLSAGTPGKRAALPNARILIHQPATGGTQGQVSDLEIQAREIMRMRTLMEETLARHTGKSAEEIRKDTDRDKILTASEAKEYGIIDQVFDYRKASAS